MNWLTRLRITLGVAGLCLYVAVMTASWFLLEAPYCALVSLGNGAAFRSRFTWHTSFHGKTLFQLFCRIFKVEAHFHLPMDDLAKIPGSLIVISNHGSTIDTPLLCAVMQRIGRTHLRWIMKASLKRWPPFGWAGILTKCGFVRRGGHKEDLQTIMHCADWAHRDGADVLSFPEGTRFTGVNGKAAFSHLRPPRLGGFRTQLMRLPNASVLSITIRWSGRNGQAFGRTLTNAADLMGRTLDIYVELIPRHTIVDDDWLNQHWHAKDDRLGEPTP